MIAYVVLHYQNIDITNQCIDSILNNDIDSKIIIVDNASPNGSGVILKSKYNSYSNVHVIINHHNEGFAKGNNIGYKYAKEIGAKIIVVMNNDVILSQDFKSNLLEIFKNEEIDIIGPNIVTPDNRHQNPLSIFNLSSIYIVKVILLNCLKIIYLSRKTFFNKYISKKNKYKQFNPSFNHDYYDCILHGSILIFGIEYVKNESFAFVPATFMYGEEFILGDFAKRAGYKTAYKSNLYVTHLGGASTALNTSMQHKVLFRFKNSTKSLLKQLILRVTPMSKIRNL